MKYRALFLCIVTIVVILSTGTALRAWEVRVDNEVDFDIRDVFVQGCKSDSEGGGCTNSGGTYIKAGGTYTFQTSASSCPTYIMYHSGPSSWNPADTAHCTCAAPSGTSYCPASCARSCADSHWDLEYVNGQAQLRKQ